MPLKEIPVKHRRIKSLGNLKTKTQDKSGKKWKSTNDIPSSLSSNPKRLKRYPFIDYESPINPTLGYINITKLYKGIKLYQGTSYTRWSIFFKHIICCI